MEQGQNNQPFFITTEKILAKRPNTSYIARNRLSLQQSFVNPQSDGQNKLKMYKEQLKKLQNQYVYQLTQLNQSKKVIDRQFRTSQKKKVLFLNLYQNRKLKHFEQKLLQEKDVKDRNHTEEIRNKAKSTKLNRQIRSLLIKTQIQQNNTQLCTKNKVQKAKVRQKISSNNSKYYEMAKSSYGKIKNSQNDLNVRKTKIAEMQMIMCKQNYFKKLGNEMKFIQCYDKLLNQVEEVSSPCQKCPTGKKVMSDFFITEK